MKLINRPVKRIFTFGCSFTSYHWMTWPEVIAHDLDVPLYNYGKSGAGNLYITNMLTQAHSLYDINEDDLVIVAWTNVCREDRWIKDSWLTPGNIFTQGEYPEDWVKRFVDPLGMLVRDLSLISLTKNLLENIGCQHHFLSMVDIVDQIDQGGSANWNSQSELQERLVNRYKTELDTLLPSFYSSLWNNDIQQHKFAAENNLFEGKFSDGHPLPADQLQHLQNVFDEHTFNQSTIDAVFEKHNIAINIIKKIVKNSKKQMAIYEFGSNNERLLKEASTLVKSEGETLI